MISSFLSVAQAFGSADQETAVLDRPGRNYDIAQVVHLFSALLLLCVALVVLGSYLMIRAILQIRWYDRLIRNLKARHSKLIEFIP